MSKIFKIPDSNYRNYKVIHQKMFLKHFIFSFICMKLFVLILFLQSYHIIPILNAGFSVIDVSLILPCLVCYNSELSQHFEFPYLTSIVGAKRFLFLLFNICIAGLFAYLFQIYLFVPNIRIENHSISPFVMHLFGFIVACVLYATHFYSLKKQLYSN